MSLTMTGDPTPAADQLLTQREIDSLRFAQDLYGARAKEGALSLGETLGLDVETRDQLIGAVAMKLEGLDFEDRRKVALGFQELASMLGGTAVVAVVPAVVAKVEKPEQVTALKPVEVSEITDRVEAPAETEATLPEDTSATPQDLMEEDHVMRKANSGDQLLGKHERTWLTRIYDEDTLGKLEAMSIEERTRFTARLTTAYVELSIPRLNANAKQQRAAQLTEILAGRSFQEVADDYGSTIEALRLGIAKMAESITKRMDQSQLIALIDDVTVSETVATEPEEETSDNVEADTEARRDSAVEDDKQEAISKPEIDREPELGSLSREQYMWLNGFLDDESIAVIAQLPTDARQRFADALGNQYATFKIRRLEPTGKIRRVQIVKDFLSNQTPMQMIEKYGLKRPSLLANLLEKIGRNYAYNMTPAEIMKLIETGQGGDIATTQESAAKESLEEELKPLGLNKLQRNWYKRIFDDDEAVEAIGEFNIKQLTYLAVRLGGFLSAVLIKQQGSFKTARRVNELKLLINGADYETISKQTNVHIDLVKQDLYHSATRIKATTPKHVLDSILKDATLHLEE